MTRGLNALVPYFGCKRQMADRILEVAGPHTAWWEPFCGSMALVLAKPACRMEVVNDKNGGVVNLARVVADDDLGPLLFDRLSRTAFCQGVYEESRAWCVEHVGRLPPSLEWAYHYFVMSWQGRNGLVGTTAETRSGFCKRHTSGGGDPATRFKNVVANIPAWWERLRGVTILAEDGFALIERVEDRRGTVLYVDPPYVAKKAQYRFDFYPEDHERLAAAVSRFKETKVVISYYDHPDLNRLYPFWEKIPVAVPKNMSVTSGAVAAPEVLLTWKR